MIANCPSCGTHYKHQPPRPNVTARCGRCDTSLLLTRFRPYRIFPAEAPTLKQAARAASYSPVGLDEPNLAATIARNVARSEPFPPPPEIALFPDFEEPSLPAAQTPHVQSAAAETAWNERPRGGTGAGLALWVSVAAIAGTGMSWTMGGSTTTGLGLGAAVGTVAYWGWRRWTSPR